MYQYPILLGVNVDHVATLRQVRNARYPDPLQAALLAQEAGADSITVHLREDRRHIQERDLELLKETLLIPMNLEMAVTSEMLAVARKIKPAYCCLVPERREELTTEGGLNVLEHQASIQEACHELAEMGIEVSLFIDPDLEQIRAASECGAHAVELHTGQYANETSEIERMKIFQILNTAAQIAASHKLQVKAGHGLNYQNVHRVAGIHPISELNIGHSIVARALLVGMTAAVAEMKRLMIDARMLLVTNH